jgi:hypothetical protein
MVVLEQLQLGFPHCGHGWPLSVVFSIGFSVLFATATSKIRPLQKSALHRV